MMDFCHRKLCHKFLPLTAYSKLLKVLDKSFHHNWIAMDWVMEILWPVFNIFGPIRVLIVADRCMI